MSIGLMGSSSTTTLAAKKRRRRGRGQRNKAEQIDGEEALSTPTE